MPSSRLTIGSYSVSLAGTGVMITPPPTDAVDLDIVSFRASGQVWIGEDGGSVSLRLVVRNSGAVNQSRNATVVGVRNAGGACPPLAGSTVNRRASA